MNDKADWKERPELGCAAGENGFEKKTDIDRVSGRNWRRLRTSLNLLRYSAISTI